MTLLDCPRSDPFDFLGSDERTEVHRELKDAAMESMKADAACELLSMGRQKQVSSNRADMKQLSGSTIGSLPKLSSAHHVSSHHAPNPLPPSGTPPRLPGAISSEDTTTMVTHKWGESETLFSCFPDGDLSPSPRSGFEP